jgi:hypothetical protein
MLPNRFTGDIVRPATSALNRARAADWAEELVGKAPFVSMVPFKDSPWGFLDIGPGADGYYCFEVAADAYEAQGFDITGRTQARQTVLQLQTSAYPGQPPAYTMLALAHALTPILGVEIANSPNTWFVARWQAQ